MEKLDNATSEKVTTLKQAANASFERPIECEGTGRGE